MARQLVCTYDAQIRISGAAKPVREVAFKTKDAAQSWLNRQKQFARDRGWAGFTFEVRENCVSKQKR